MLGVNRGLTCQHQINNAQHISNRNLDKLSYRFSIMHEIELPDAPIGGFFLKKNMLSHKNFVCVHFQGNKVATVCYYIGFSK